MSLHLLHEEIDQLERQRLQKLMVFEEQARQKGCRVIAGLDEAGRGPLAGPLVAVACVIPPLLFIPGVNDSKKLLPKRAEEIFHLLTKDPEISYGIGIVEVEEIDKINIFQATIKAMLQAVQNLPVKPDCLLVDGLALPHPSIPAQKIIGGDAVCYPISAASIIAKETRDRLMLKLHESWPAYGFDKHKGYGTSGHMEALQKHGPCPAHRKTFEPIKTMLRPPDPTLFS